MVGISDGISAQGRNNSGAEEGVVRFNASDESFQIDAIVAAEKKLEFELTTSIFERAEEYASMKED